MSSYVFKKREEKNSDRGEKEGINRPFGGCDKIILVFPSPSVISHLCVSSQC